MRGAVLMSAVDGRRLERDPARGVRASRMDYTPECRAELADWMSTAGLKSNRFVEALAVATKVAWSGVAAEICWSDDPTYAPGYVASPRFGYCRFPRLKALGTALGGRVFFLVDLSHSLEVIRRLEHCPLLIDRLSKEAPPFPVLDEVL
jgi:6-carboxyhexanoate--CoA ligase